MSHNPAKLLGLASKFEKLSQEISGDENSISTLDELLNNFENVVANFTGQKKISGLQRLINKYSQSAMTPGGQTLESDPDAWKKHQEFVNGPNVPTNKSMNAPAERELDSQTKTPLVDSTDPGYANSTGNPEPTDNYSQNKKPGSYSSIDPYTQKALNKLNYPVGKADGILGPATRKALDKYKADKALKSDQEAIAAINTEFQQEFPGMQMSHNDSDYSEERGGKPATPLAAPSVPPEVPPNPYATKPMTDEKPYG